MNDSVFSWIVLLAFSFWGLWKFFQAISKEEEERHEYSEREWEKLQAEWREAEMNGW